MPETRSPEVAYVVEPRKYKTHEMTTCLDSENITSLYYLALTEQGPLTPKTLGTTLLCGTLEIALCAWSYMNT